MSIERNGLSELCFAAEGMAGTAGASTLRRVRSLAEAAPSGRLFGAIATLADLSRQSERHLLAAGAAMTAGDKDRAARSFARALTAMDDMAAGAEGSLDIPDLMGDVKSLRR
jgi:hypothetical protein